MTNESFHEIVKHQAMFKPSLADDFRELDYSTEDGKITSLNLNIMDPSIDFVKNVEIKKIKTYKILKKE